MPGIVSPLDSTTTRKKLSAEISARLKKNDFESIESLANSARSSKQRIPGGFWKLYVIYDGLTEPNLEQKSTELEWQEHIGRLEAWKTAMPNSVTAKVATAGAWVYWAVDARGEGFAHTVSEHSWQLFRERSQMASDELAEAKKSDLKCPQWYVVALSVGLVQNWSRTQYDKVFEEGFRLEPTYYHIQREKLTYLFPQWNGKNGEQGAFIKENASRIEGDEGLIMYFLLTSILQSHYRMQLFQKVDVPWEKVKEGYQALERHYKTDRFRKNQYAYMAMFGRDIETASAEMQEIGDDWDPEVWGTRETFENIKKATEDYRSIQSRNQK
ncbi:MAG: DUF4034 domain-containing protein [Acidobacteria bacterium]|nr:DUF4034 domain-containing protein [Acidobacteriota bacterium]